MFITLFARASDNGASTKLMVSLVDRNPQKFMDIPKAKDSDFQKATERIFRSGKLSSSITIPVQGKIEEKLETWMRLEINGENTRIVDLKNEGASLDFLGYTFRYERDCMEGSQVSEYATVEEGDKRERENSDGEQAER